MWDGMRHSTFLEGIYYESTQVLHSQKQITHVSKDRGILDVNQDENGYRRSLAYDICSSWFYLGGKDLSEVASIYSVNL